jgi:hypothetical protein
MEKHREKAAMSTKTFDSQNGFAYKKGLLKYIIFQQSLYITGNTVMDFLPSSLRGFLPAAGFQSALKWLPRA